MARHVSLGEKSRIFRLVRAGASDKEISDRICQEFDRDTLDRSTIRSIRKMMVLSPTMRLPATPTQQAAWERCQIRSERYPKGDHKWMIGDRFADSFTVNQLDEDLTRGELVEESEGWFTTSSTCWFCGFTTEPRDEWGQVWVVAA